MELGDATYEDFEACLNERFRLEVESPTELELVSVEPRGGFEPSSQKRRAFALLFRGPQAPVLSQRIYALSHDSLGRLDLFLVPVGPDHVGMLYEAVFT